MSARGFFITGTDTGVGKTVVAAALVRGLVKTGFRVAVMKPVASGSERKSEGLRNEDALTLMAASNVPAPYETVNPYCFEPPISPHIAAEEARIAVNVGEIRRNFDTVSRGADWTVVEGAGGWLAPIGAHQSIRDLALALELPVVMVVAVRLGCINHALLTKLAIEAHGAHFAGWIANTLEAAMPRRAENLETLAQLLGELPLATVPALSPSSPPLELAEAAARLSAEFGGETRPLPRVPIGG